MTLCHLRDLHECGCAAGQCVAAPPKPIEPVGRLSPMAQAFVIACLYTLLGSVGLTVWYAALSRADEGSRKYLLITQEDVRHG